MKFAFFRSYYEALKELAKEEVYDVVTAMCEYAFSGKEGVNAKGEPLKGAAKAVFAVIRPNIERSIEISKARAEAGSKGGKQRSSNTQANEEFASSKNKQNDDLLQANDDFASSGVGVGEGVGVGKGKKKTTQEDLVRDSFLSDPVKEKLIEWLKYKKERRETYKETGLKNLVSEVARHEQESGAEAVINLITQCMANGWRGIIWDRLKEQPRGVKSPAFPQRSYNFDEMEKALVKNK